VRPSPESGIVAIGLLKDNCSVVAHFSPENIRKGGLSVASRLGIKQRKQGIFAIRVNFSPHKFKSHGSLLMP
jgi:hypothetical protein